MSEYCVNISEVHAAMWRIAELEYLFKLKGAITSMALFHIPIVTPLFF
jgi:hypothetical protein